MMLSSTLAIALFVCSVAQAQKHKPSTTTWSSTTLVTYVDESSVTVKYGNSPVTPVPTSTAPLVMATSYLTEPTGSRNINETIYKTVTEKQPLATTWEYVYVTRTAPPTVTKEVTTENIWTSPILATITLPAATNGSCSEVKKTTVTKYTSTYRPVPGQVTTTKTRWPTAVIAYAWITEINRVFPYTGSTASLTSTVTSTVYRSTTTLTETLTVPSPQDVRVTRTQYRTTITTTSSDWQLAYVTPPAVTRCAGAAHQTTTITQAAKCAPTNLISERDHHGVAVRLNPAEWRFPLGFDPGPLIGIPVSLVPDPSACCQLCVDNPGCAASEFMLGWDTACRLHYYGHPTGGKANDTCGNDEVRLEYYADTYALPGQEAFIQVGCGSLNYAGVRDPFCWNCTINEGDWAHGE